MLRWRRNRDRRRSHRTGGVYSLKKVLLCVETFAQLIDLLLLQSDLGLEELNFILSGGCSSGIVLRRVIVSAEQRRDQCESRSASEEKGGGSHLSATLIWALGCRSSGCGARISCAKSA